MNMRPASCHSFYGVANVSPNSEFPGFHGCENVVGVHGHLSVFIFHTDLSVAF